MRHSRYGVWIAVCSDRVDIIVVSSDVDEGGNEEITEEGQMYRDPNVH